MAVVHLKHNEKTRCGFPQFGFESTSRLTEVSCWDCLDSHFSSYFFKEEVRLLDDKKEFELSVFQNENKASSLKCLYSPSFIPLVQDVWVCPSFRGCGLATIMMKRLMRRTGPPLLLKAEAFLSCKNEPEGLNNKALADFYSRLGFVSLTTPKMMLWYPTVTKSSVRIAVIPEDGHFKAYLPEAPGIKGLGTTYSSAIGNLILEHSQVFGVTLVQNSIVELVKE